MYIAIQGIVSVDLTLYKIIIIIIHFAGTALECGVPDYGCVYLTSTHWDAAHGDRVQQALAVWGGGAGSQGEHNHL